MAYEAKVIKDSTSPDGARLTTIEATYPRFVHAEMMTHRVFSRNTASSRAIPVEKQLAKVLDDPVLPVYWGANRAGMQASEELTGYEQDRAADLWLEGRDMAVLSVAALVGGIKALKDERLQDMIIDLSSDYKFGIADRQLATPLHKQIANRLLEPYLWHTAIITATEWDNFYGLRLHPDAQPEIQRAAQYMYGAYATSKPEEVGYGEYHLPYLHEEDADLSLSERIEACIGRCARVSYLTQDGKRDPSKDIELFERLVSGGHMSPLEHIARPFSESEVASREYYRDLIRTDSAIEDTELDLLIEASYFAGNFRGWHQYRKDIPNEADFSTRI